MAYNVELSARSCIAHCPRPPYATLRKVRIIWGFHHLGFLTLKELQANRERSRSFSLGIISIWCRMFVERSRGDYVDTIYIGGDLIFGTGYQLLTMKKNGSIKDWLSSVP